MIKEDSRMFRSQKDIENLMRKKAEKCLKENLCFRCDKPITKKNVSPDALLCYPCYRLYNINPHIDVENIRNEA